MEKKVTSFRYDINALRAIAVIGVLLFHFKFPYAKGGFAGVDIFFVISGYLMTKIIITGLRTGDFSVLDFYGKRLKRIVPALLVLIVVLTVVGFFLCFPADYMLNEQNAAASVLFLSNIFYWRNSGYFDPSSETNVLLHTWSLSVEWQFYLIYPIVLPFFIKNFKEKKHYITVFIAITIVGMVGSIFLTHRSPTASFYLLPSRAWELMFGGITFFLENKLTNSVFRRLLSITGYITLFTCIFLLQTTMAWPGIFTIIPVLATAIIILSNYNDYTILQSNWVQLLGKMSYSLYLWHWPIYVIAQYFAVGTTPTSALILIFLSGGFGYLSYRYVESFHISSNKLILATMLLVVASTSLLGVRSTNDFMFKPLSIYLANYEDNHVDKKSQFSGGCCFVSSADKGLQTYNADKCLKLSGTKDNILLLGDSHAAQYSLSLKNALKDSDINVMQATSSGCSPVKRLNGEIRCSEVMDFVYNRFIQQNAGRIDGIVLAANWEVNSAAGNTTVLADIQNTIKFFEKLKIPVIVLGQIETFHISYSLIAAKEYEYNIALSEKYLKMNSYRINDLLRSKLKNYYINIINPKIPALYQHKVPYMFDYSHLTQIGAEARISKILVNPVTVKFLRSAKLKHQVRNSANSRLATL